MVLAFRMDGCSGAGGAVELMSCRAFRAWSGEGQARSGDIQRAGARRDMAMLGSMLNCTLRVEISQASAVRDW